MQWLFRVVASLFASVWITATNGPSALAQVAPSTAEIARYGALHMAAQRNDPGGIASAVKSGEDVDLRDGSGRTAIHIAAHASAYDAFRALKVAGADMRALDRQDYDAITIAAVNDDVRMVELAIELGGDPAAITSPYKGTALIAAAHLGHAEVVQALIDAGAPLDHVNNLRWTALMEAVVLGDGGARHAATARALVKAGADKSITDGFGRTPLENARARGFSDLVSLLE